MRRPRNDTFLHALPGLSSGRSRGGAKRRSTQIKCLCDYEQTVPFPAPKMFGTTRVEHKCENCGSLWSFTFRKNPTDKKGHLKIVPAPVSISQRCVEYMKTKQVLVPKKNEKGDPQMTTNLTALTSAIKLVADAAKDTALAIQPGQSTLQLLLDYENLPGDLVVLLPQIGDVPKELSALALPDVVTLTRELVTDLAVTDAHAQIIIGASLKLLNDIVIVLVPDIEALIMAIQTAPPAPAPAA